MTEKADVNNDTVTVQKLLPHSPVKYIIGPSGSGKSSFLKKLLGSYPAGTPVYVSALDRGEYEKSNNFILLDKNPFVTVFDFSQIPDGSVLVIEDYIAQPSHKNFQYFVNYRARHHRIDTYIVTHQLYYNKLSFFLQHAQELYLTTAHANLLIAKRLDASYNLGLVNTLENLLKSENSQYSVLAVFSLSTVIHPFEELVVDAEETDSLGSVIMLSRNNRKYYLLDTERYEVAAERENLNEKKDLQPTSKQVTEENSAAASTNDDDDDEDRLINLVLSTYPKNRNIKLLSVSLYKKLKSLGLVNDEFIIVIKNKKIAHLMDVVAFTQRVKTESIPNNIQKVLTMLRTNNFYVMTKLVKNALTKKYLCIGHHEPSK